MSAWPSVWAHRCGGVLAPENTLAGLRVSQALGCGAVEFDVMLSRDGVPVLIHDETLDRTTNGHGWVAETSAAVLAGLDAGTWFDSRFATESIPLLRDAVALCVSAGLVMNVEIKPGRGREAETAGVIARTLEHLGCDPGMMLLSSFSTRALAVLGTQAPKFPRGLLVDSIPPDWQARCDALGCQWLHCNSRALDEGTVAEILASGRRLVVYTENDVVAAKTRLDWGVAGVITDRPDVLVPALEGRGWR